MMPIIGRKKINGPADKYSSFVEKSIDWICCVTLEVVDQVVAVEHRFESLRNFYFYHFHQKISISEFSRNIAKMGGLKF